MYVGRDAWSAPEEGDPGPCFRQGDVVALDLVRPKLTLTERGAQLSGLDVEKVQGVLLSYCCDLVPRKPPKRKSVLFSPLRSLPKQLKKGDRIRPLILPLREAIAAGLAIPFNLVRFSEVPGVSTRERVIFLEDVYPVSFDILVNAEKLAELTDAARDELRERLAAHFTRMVLPSEAEE